MPRAKESKASALSKPKVLTDWVYAVLKDEILSLRIKPRSQLHVVKLSERLGLSRAPIREALLRLENQGLVEVHPRIGFFVSDVTESDMAELFEIREWLETKAAKKMAEQLSEADTVFFNRLISETERAVTKNDESRFLECEENFHDYIIRRCGNRHLLSVMEGINDLIHRERLLSVKSRENIELTLVEHKRIVNAICKKDPEEAASMMSDHIRSAGQRLCKRLSQIIQI